MVKENGISGFCEARGREKWVSLLPGKQRGEAGCRGNRAGHSGRPTTCGIGAVGQPGVQASLHPPGPRSNACAPPVPSTSALHILLLETLLRAGSSTPPQTCPAQASGASSAWQERRLEQGGKQGLTAALHFFMTEPLTEAQTVISFRSKCLTRSAT